MKNKSLPNIIIPGAPKAGTTAIAAILNEHPDFFMPSLKEPRFFIKTEIDNLSIKDPLRKYLKQSSVLEWENYKKIYEGSTAKIKVDASIQYLYYHETTIPLIKEKLGDPFILIILRDPVKRTLSNFKFNRASEPYSNIMDSIEAELAGKKDDLNSFFHYYKQGLYTNGVKAFLENFSRVKVVFFEDFLADNLAFINAILEDLDLSKMENIPELPKLNSSAELSILGKILFRKFAPYTIIDKTVLSLVMSPGDRFQQRLKLKSKFLVNRDKQDVNTEEVKEYLKDLYKEDGIELKSLLSIEKLPWENIEI